MAAAILINQTTRPAGVLGVARDDGVIDQVVTCSSGTVAASYLWVLVDVPIRSGLTRGTVGVGSTFTFTPDIKGTYLVSLQLNGSSLAGDNAQNFIAIKSFGIWTRAWRYLAAREQNIDNILRPGLGFPGNVNTRGWATNEDLIFEEIEEATARVLTAVTTSPGAGVDALVKLDPITGQFDPSVVATPVSFARWHVPAAQVVNVPTDHEYLVSGPLVLEAGATINLAAGARLSII